MCNMRNQRLTASDTAVYALVRGLVIITYNFLFYRISFFSRLVDLFAFVSSC